MHGGFLGTFDFKLQKELGNCIKKRSRLAIQRTGGTETFSLTWKKVCQSTGWLWSWVALVEALYMCNLDLDKLLAVLYTCHTKDHFCPCKNRPEGQEINTISMTAEVSNPHI